MKNIILILFLFVPAFLLAQYPYPATGNKQRLGHQTTGDGLVFRGSGAPAYTPSSRVDPYIFLDTVANRYYHYSSGAWRDLSDEKYIHFQDANFLASPVKDSLTTYDRLFVAMEITSGGASDRGVQLPVTALDTSYAGRVVRVSAVDSSGTYDVFVSSSSPDGLLVDGVLTTTYYLEAEETAEFQLYVFNDTYQWRLVHTNDIEPLPSDNVTGSGTSGTLTKWTGTNTIGDAAVTEDATRLSASLPFRLANIPTISLPGVPSSGDVVMNTTENELWAYRNSSWDAIAYWRKSGNNISYTNGKAAVGTTGGSAMFTVRETSTSNLFRMETSAGILGMSFRSDGLFQLGSRGMTIAPVTGAYNVVNIAGSTLSFFPANNSNSTILGSFAFVDYGYSTYSANTKTVRIAHYPGNPFAQSSGAQTYTALEVTPSINQTGTATGTITGIDYTPTLTSILGTHYGILIRPTAAKNGFGTGTPVRTLHVAGEVRITDLTTDTPTRVVGADADGDLGEITFSTLLDSLENNGLSSYTGFTPAADNGSGDDIESGDTFTIEGDVDIETEITSQTIAIRNKWNPALIFYVSAFGDDATGQRGNPQRPFLNFSTAVDSSEAVTGSWIYVNDGAHTFTASGDTLIGLNVFIDAAATLAARVRSGLFYAQGKFTVTYRPQTVNNLTQIYGQHIVLGIDMSLGGSLEVNAGIIEVSSGGEFVGTSVKNVRLNSNILLQQEVGEFGGDMSNLNYAAQCNVLRSNSTALFAFGDGSTTTAMNDNRVSVKANRSEIGSTIGLLFIDIPSDGSFARNKINIEINEWTKAGPIIATTANIRQSATNGSSSLIKLHLGSFHSTATTGTDVIGISTTSKDDQFLTPFVISGHIMSDSLPVLAVTGTLGIGFRFTNTTMEVRKAGVNVVDIATLNTSSNYLLSFTNVNMRNDGSTAKIDVTTPTTKAKGDYRDLNDGSEHSLSYGDGTITGTAAYYRGITAEGKVIDVAIPSASVASHIITRTIYDGSDALPDSTIAASGVFDAGFWRVPESMDGYTMTKASFGVFDKGDVSTSGATYVFSLWVCDVDNASCTNTSSVSFTPSSETELELSLSLTLNANDIIRIAYTPPQSCAGGCGTENVNGLVVTYTIEE